MKIIGSSHFPTRSDMMRYYQHRYHGADTVKHVTERGNVHISSPPKVNPSDEVLLRSDLGGARRFTIEVIA